MVGGGGVAVAIVVGRRFSTNNGRRKRIVDTQPTSSTTISILFFGYTVSVVDLEYHQTRTHEPETFPSTRSFASSYLVYC